MLYKDVICSFVHLKFQNKKLSIKQLSTAAFKIKSRSVSSIGKALDCETDDPGSIPQRLSVLCESGAN
jgi:hypothetical protein